MSLINGKFHQLGVDPEPGADMPRVRCFSNGAVAVTCAGQAMHLRAHQALALAQVLAALLLEDNK